MESIIDKILYKFYIQDFWTYFIRKFGINKDNYVERTRIVKLFVNDLARIENTVDQILSLACKHFYSKQSRFFDICLKLIQQILFEPNSKELNINYDKLNIEDIALLIFISDSFGRFDLGLILRYAYCRILENRATNENTNRKHKIIYNMHKSLFGDDLLVNQNQIVNIEVPFFLKEFHYKFTFKHNRVNNNLTKVDNVFLKKIQNRSIALLAPGIIEFDENLIQELFEFDEIITITYTKDQYKALPIKINISYYNRPNSLKIINDKLNDIQSNDLELFCMKYTVRGYSNFREIYNDSFRWFLGSPNMGQSAIYDILSHNPRKLKVFGMNFFLSKLSHNKNYPSEGVSIKSLAEHNIVSNFLYVKKLMLDNRIEIDQMSTNIINAGIENYVSKMMELYS